MASYPSAIYPVPTFGPNQNDAKTHEDWRNEITDEVRALQIELGTEVSLDKSTTKDAIEAAGRMVFVSEGPAVATNATTGATFVDWITVDSITLPVWTTSVIVHIDITNVGVITAAALYVVDVKVGAVAPGADRAALDFTGTTDRVNCSFTAPVTTSGTGAQNLILQAKRVSGTGQMQAGSTTKISGFVQFIG